MTDGAQTTWNGAPRLHEMAHALYRSLTRHPRLAVLISARTTAGEHEAHRHRAHLKTLVDAGLPIDEAVTVWRSFADTILAWCGLSAAFMSLPSESQARDEVRLVHDLPPAARRPVSNDCTPLAHTSRTSTTHSRPPSSFCLTASQYALPHTIAGELNDAQISRRAFLGGVERRWCRRCRRHDAEHSLSASGSGKPPPSSSAVESSLATTATPCVQSIAIAKDGTHPRRRPLQEPPSTTRPPAPKSLTPSGGTVMAGIQDGHAHPMYAGLRSLSPSLEDAELTGAEVQDLVAVSCSTRRSAPNPTLGWS